MNTRYFSNKQEKKVAKQVGGRKVANSGATKFSKGDVVIDSQWLIECKTVTKEQKSFTIQREWLDKNIEEAFAMRCPYNALAFDFGDGEQHYIIDSKTFKRMIELFRRDDNEM